MLIDPSSLDLARHFLSDLPFATEEDARRLAEAIQTAVEDFISDLQERKA